MRTSNPALNDKTFTREVATDETMTIQGTVNKTALLLAIVVAVAAWTWSKFFAAPTPELGVAAVMPWMLGGLLGGLVVGIVTIFVPRWAMVTAPLYAALEGLFVGGISALMEVQFPGIVIQAVGLTFGTAAAMLVAYSSRLITVTDNFRLGVVAATGGIALVYLATLLLGLFGIRIPYIHDSGLIGIGFSLFVVVIAALNLVLDFDFIEQGARAKAPKYMEWYGAYALLVTLVWLYIEILRLLSKLRSRD
jgi:uncharacterized YccA/Bax inhibitor family protein